VIIVSLRQTEYQNRRKPSGAQDTGSDKDILRHEGLKELISASGRADQDVPFISKIFCKFFESSTSTKVS
jgi:hypothetical protein